MAKETPPATVDERHCFFRYSTAVCRIWGFAACIVIWTCTILMIQDNKGYVYIHWYLLGVSILMSFLETTWLIDKSACCRREGVCCACWTIIVWVDNWKKTLLYIGLSIPCFLTNNIRFYGILCGVIILVTAFLNFMKSFTNCECVVRKQKQTQYIQIKSTSLTRQLVEHEIQTDSSEYAPAGQTPIETAHARTVHASEQSGAYGSSASHDSIQPEEQVRW